MPFFSIAIPVYNAEQYLDTCIKSIIDQSEKDYELILVNDGSTDNSEAKCLEWRNKYPKLIRYYKKDNSGSLLTRRRCLKEAKGEYIYLIDADDYLLSNHILSTIKQRIIETGSDLVFFNATNDYSKKSPYFKYPFPDNTIYEGEKLKEIYEYILSNYGFNPLWNKIYNRCLVDFDEDYSSYSYITNGTDFFQMLPIVSHSKRMLYVDKIFYYYRTDNNRNSIVHAFKPTVYSSMKENYLRLKLFSSKWGIDENIRKRALNKRMMMIASTGAYKVRLMHNSTLNEKINYLSMIGNDIDFQKAYTTSGIRMFRRIIVYLLYHKMYRLLAIVLK